MLRIAQGQRALIQLQLVRLGAEGHRATEQRFVTRRIFRCLELDMDCRGHQRLPAQACQLGDPAGKHGVDHETVVGVVRADGIEAQPGTGGVFVEA